MNRKAAAQSLPALRPVRVECVDVATGERHTLDLVDAPDAARVGRLVIEGHYIRSGSGEPAGRRHSVYAYLDKPSTIDRPAVGVTPPAPTVPREPDVSVAVDRLPRTAGWRVERLPGQVRDLVGKPGVLYDGGGETVVSGTCDLRAGSCGVANIRYAASAGATHKAVLPGNDCVVDGWDVASAYSLIETNPGETVAGLDVRRVVVRDVPEALQRYLVANFGRMSDVGIVDCEAHHSEDESIVRLDDRTERSVVRGCRFGNRAGTSHPSRGGPRRKGGGTKAAVRLGAGSHALVEDCVLTAVLSMGPLGREQGRATPRARLRDVRVRRCRLRAIEVSHGCEGLWVRDCDVETPDEGWAVRVEGPGGDEFGGRSSRDVLLEDVRVLGVPGGQPLVWVGPVVGPATLRRLTVTHDRPPARSDPQAPIQINGDARGWRVEGCRVRPVVMWRGPDAARGPVAVCTSYPASAWHETYPGVEVLS